MVRGEVYRVAAHLQNLFGLQKEQPHVKTKGAEPVLVKSSLDNVTDHLTALMMCQWSRLDDATLNDETEAFYQVVNAVHTKVMFNFKAWMEHIEFEKHMLKVAASPSPSLSSYTEKSWESVTEWEFPSDDRGSKRTWLLTMELTQLTLYMLIHGESANLRHLPEGLCLIGRPVLVQRTITGTGTPHPPRFQK